MVLNQGVPGVRDWDKIVFCGGAILLFVGLPCVGIYLAIVTGNPWWLWLIVPLMGFMEAGLFLIGVILTVVWVIMGV